MRTTTALLVALAAASVSGTPTAIKRQDESEEVYESWPSKEKYCDWDLSTPESVEDRWDGYVIDATMDAFLRTYDHDVDLDINWLTEWEKYVNKDGGKLGASGCGTIGTHCDPAPGMSCYDFVDQANENGYQDWRMRDAYWIFQAVKGMHSKFGELHRLMIQDTLVAGFSISEMIDVFGGGEEDTSKALTWIAAAFGMGGTVAGMMPGPGKAISAGAGIVSGIISNTIAAKDALGEEPVTSDDMEKNLVDAFTAASDALENTIRISTGGSDKKDEYLTLPAPRNDFNKAKVAKFFNGGWFLLDDNSKAVQDLFSSVKGNLRRKVASDVMNGAGWKLMIDRRHQVNNGKKCRTRRRGGRWLEFKDGDFGCFYLAEYSRRIISSGGFGKMQESEEEASVKVYEAMKSFGFDRLEEYYRRVLDCVLHGGKDKELDMSTLGYGKPPRCYFVLEAMFINDTSGCKDGGCGDNADGAFSMVG